MKQNFICIPDEFSRTQMTPVDHTMPKFILVRTENHRKKTHLIPVYQTVAFGM